MIHLTQNPQNKLSRLKTGIAGIISESESYKEN